MFACLKDKVFLAFAIGLELWRQRHETEDLDAVPLPPIIPAEGHAMRWEEGEFPTRRDVKPVSTAPLKGSLADRMNQARKQ